MSKKSLIILLSLIFLSGCHRADVNTLNNRAKDLLEKGEYDKAIGRLESILDIAPDYHLINYNLGIAYVKKGDYANAIEALKREIKTNPDFPDSYYSLGTVYEYSALDYVSKLKKIEEEAAKGSGDHSKTPLVKQESKDQLIEIIMGQYELSIKSFESYIRLLKSEEEQREIQSHVDLVINDFENFKRKHKVS